MLIPEHQLPNGTSIEFTDPWSIYEDREAGIFSWAILGIFFFFFFGLVARDMFRKYRSGELKEDGKDCLEILTIFMRLPVILFSKDNMRGLWISISNIFRRTANKRRPGTIKPGVILRDRFDSAAVIERLGGGSTSSQSSGDGKEAKGKAKEVSQLPKRSEHPSSKAAPFGRGIPPFEGLPVVFEVPDILPEDRHTPSRVHRLGSGSNSNIDLEPGQGDHLTSVGNGGLFIQSHGESNPAGHGSASGSGSHGYSHHHSDSISGSHTHDYSGGGFYAGGSCDAGGGGCD
ncbi:hypothetical protein ACHAPJ_008250 [Fusarium lateritium]